MSTKSIFSSTRKATPKPEPTPQSHEKPKVHTIPRDKWRSLAGSIIHPQHNTWKVRISDDKIFTYTE